MERPQKPTGRRAGHRPPPHALKLRMPIRRTALLRRSALLLLLSPLCTLALVGCGEAPAPEATIPEDAVAGNAVADNAVADNAVADNAVADKTDAPTVSGILIRPVPGVPRLPAGPPDENGRRALVACSTCHSIKPPAPTQRGGPTLREFHQGLQVVHGSLTCLSCHNADDYDTLRLADGQPVPFEDVKRLCSQCHGPQASAYAHGAHGGMSGYWDTSLGEQVRNQCTHCHAPHAPAYPQMRPTFKPRDRFLTPRETASSKGAR